MGEVVGRIQAMTSTTGHNWRFLFKTDQFVPIQFFEKSHKGGGTVGIPAILIRKNEDGQVVYTVPQRDTLLRVKDVIRTAPDTILAIEFLIGGRVSVNSGTVIEIVNERSVADGRNGIKRTFLKNASLWLKSDSNALKEPIEIQTNGGVMGVKG
jgi:hypothetical protein